MANFLKPISYCSALLLLLSGVCWLSNSNVAATSCLSGIKSVFCSSKSTSYEKLANHLFQYTPSSELADNTAIAMELLGKEERPKDRQKNHELKHLASVFSSINDTNEEQLCRAWTLRNVRLMVDAMARDATNNMDPTSPARKITDPVRRLNRIIIRLVERASNLCWEHLESKFPAAWEPRFSFADMHRYLERLDELPSKVIFHGYLSESASSSQESSKALWEALLAERVAKIIAADQLLFSKSPNVHLAWTQDSLVGLIERYIRKPCGEFMVLHESQWILEPYLDLLLSSFAITPGIGAIDNFYHSSPSEQRPRMLHTWSHNEKVLRQAKRLKACELLHGGIATTHLANLVMRVQSGPLEY